MKRRYLIGFFLFVLVVIVLFVIPQSGGNQNLNETEMENILERTNDSSYNATEIIKMRHENKSLYNETLKYNIGENNGSYAQRVQDATGYSRVYKIYAPNKSHRYSFNSNRSPQFELITPKTVYPGDANIPIPNSRFIFSDLAPFILSSEGYEKSKENNSMIKYSLNISNNSAKRFIESHVPYTVSIRSGSGHITIYKSNETVRSVKFTATGETTSATAQIKSGTSFSFNYTFFATSYNLSEPVWINQAKNESQITKNYPEVEISQNGHSVDVTIVSIKSADSIEVGATGKGRFLVGDENGESITLSRMNGGDTVTVYSIKNGNSKAIESYTVKNK